MTYTKRSDTQYPNNNYDLSGALAKAWVDGWMDEFSNDHFLIKAIEGRLEKYRGYHQFVANNASLYQVNEKNFQEIFCMNFSWKVACLVNFFGEDKIKSFFY